MQNVLLVVQLLVAVALVAVILVQRTAQDGGGLTGGGSTMCGLFTARGSANLLTRMTAVLAVIFIANSLALGAIAGSQHRANSLIDQIAPTMPASAPAMPAMPETPAAPQVPLAK